MNTPLETRLANYEQHLELIDERDDVLIEYITLLNSVGRHQDAYDTIMSHTFRPWEGAEGKVTTQYKASLCEMAKEKLAHEDYAGAKELLEKALVYPLNLGEGRLEGTKDNNLYFYLGCAEEALGNEAAAKECFEKASLGEDEPAGMMYYYDQPADMILCKGLAQQKLGHQKAANACFYKLIDYGEKHIRDNMRIDYFAVSLPELEVFPSDMQKRNICYCRYLTALGELGLGNYHTAASLLDSVLEIQADHQGCLQHKLLLNQFTD